MRGTRLAKPVTRHHLFVVINCLKWTSGNPDRPVTVASIPSSCLRKDCMSLVDDSVTYVECQRKASYWPLDLDVFRSDEDGVMYYVDVTSGEPQSHP